MTNYLTNKFLAFVYDVAMSKRATQASCQDHEMNQYFPRVSHRALHRCFSLDDLAVISFSPVPGKTRPYHWGTFSLFIPIILIILSSVVKQNRHLKQPLNKKN